MRKQFFSYQKVLQEICSTYSNVIFGLRERLDITKAGDQYYYDYVTITISIIFIIIIVITITRC